MARLRRYIVQPDSLGAVLTTGTTLEVTDGLPQGADIVRIGYDEERDELWMMARHADFDDVKDGDILPRHGISVRTLNNK